MASREEAKSRRRKAIMLAARSLMQQRGDTGFSMRALADAAGVSIATPYNLFGSKQAVMFAVLDSDLERFARGLEKLEADELEIFFEAVSLATGAYAAEPKFHKAVLFAVYSDGGRDYRAMFSGPRLGFWKNLVDRAINAGVITPAIDSAAFALALSHLFFSCILEWVSGELSVRELETRTHYGFTLLLAGAATVEARQRLLPRLPILQERLQTLWAQHHGARTAATG